MNYYVLEHGTFSIIIYVLFCKASQQISSQQQPELLIHAHMVPCGIPLISGKLMTVY